MNRWRDTKSLSLGERRLLVSVAVLALLVVLAPATVAARNHHQPKGIDVVSGYNITTLTGQSIVPGTVDIGNHGDDTATTIALPFPVYLSGTAYASASLS